MLEGDPLRTLLVEESRQIPGDVALAPADERDLREPLEDAVGNRTCPADRVELTLLLHGAEPLYETAARHELEPALLERLVLLVRERRGLEGEPAREALGELVEHGASRLHDLDVRHGARRLDVAEVGEELHALVVDEQRGVRAVEADEVEDVLRIRDEERLLELLA